MILLDKLLAGGLRFVLERIADAADAERDDVATLREELLAAQMRRELGEITDDELERTEAEILARLRELRGEEQGPVALRGAGDSLSVDVTVSSEDEES